MGTTYVYSTYDGVETYIDSTLLTFKGLWLTATSYAAYDVVDYGSAKYIALQSSNSTPPSGNLTEYWSVTTPKYAPTPEPEPSDPQSVQILIGSLPIAYEPPIYFQNGTVFISGGGGGGIASAQDLQQEEAYRAYADGTLMGSLVAVSDSVFNNLVPLINAEVTARVIADGTLMDSISLEQYYRVLAEGTTMGSLQAVSDSVFNNLVPLINAEVTARVVADGTLMDSIAALEASIQGTSTVLASDLMQEERYRAVNDGTNAAAISAEAITRAGADSTITNNLNVTNTTANNAWELANQLAQRGAVGLSGTWAGYLSFVRYGKPDIRLNVIDGVVSNVEDSKFVWDDFSQYSVGPIGTSFGQLDLGTGWNGTGVIFTDTLYGLKAYDTFETYSLGTIWSLDGGYGFSGTGNVQDPYARLVGTETFEEYMVGPITDTGTLTGGWGWAGTITIV